jgi:hypothetical protein
MLFTAISNLTLVERYFRMPLFVSDVFLDIVLKSEKNMLHLYYC